MGFALLFAGQGSQHAGMLPWLSGAPEAAPLLAALDAALGRPWHAVASQEELTRNRIAQPLIVGTALAAWQALSARLSQAPVAVAVAGYSVGELAAYAAAGVIAPGQALALAGTRAALMDEAASGTATGLLSISGMAEPDVLARCPGLEPAIRIEVDHGLYAGTVQALDAAERSLGDIATCRRIEVALASHSSWMRPAAAGFARALEGVTFARPRCAVATDATGAATRDPRALAEALSRQIDHTVEWGGCMAAVAERGPRCVLEIGPGQALARMWSRQHPDIPARSIGDFRDADGAAAWIARHG